LQAIAFTPSHHREHFKSQTDLVTSNIWLLAAAVVVLGMSVVAVVRAVLGLERSLPCHLVLTRSQSGQLALLGQMQPEPADGAEMGAALSSTPSVRQAVVAVAMPTLESVETAVLVVVAVAQRAAAAGPGEPQTSITTVVVLYPLALTTALAVVAALAVSAHRPRVTQMVVPEASVRHRQSADHR
jgi:hypothetical protein